MTTDDVRFLVIYIIAAASITWIVRDTLREKAIERRAAVEMPTVMRGELAPDLDTWANYPMPTPIADRRRRIAAEFDHDLANIRDLPETDHRETR